MQRPRHPRRRDGQKGEPPPPRWRATRRRARVHLPDSPFSMAWGGGSCVLHLVGNDAALIAARPNGPPARWEGVSAELPAGRPRQLVHQHHFSRLCVGRSSRSRDPGARPATEGRRSCEGRRRRPPADPTPGDARPHRPRRPSGGSRGAFDLSRHTVSAPVRIASSSLPATCRRPSASIAPASPVRNHPRTSNAAPVAAASCR